MQDAEQYARAPMLINDALHISGSWLPGLGGWEVGLRAGVQKKPVISAILVCGRYTLLTERSGHAWPVLPSRLPCSYPTTYLSIILAPAMFSPARRQLIGYVANGAHNAKHVVGVTDGLRLIFNPLICQLTTKSIKFNPPLFR